MTRPDITKRHFITIREKTMNKSHLPKKPNVNVIFGGPGIDNNRNAIGETIISPDNVDSLTIKFVIPTVDSVSATPVTFNNNVYFPDWAGWIYSANARTGMINWKYKVSEKYLPQPADPKAISRDTFAIDPTEQLIIFGTQNAIEGGSGYVIAIDLKGDLVWITLIDDHPLAVITQSPTIYNGGVYIGVSSVEEGVASNRPGYVCCTFQGSFAKLNLTTGQILWKTLMLPYNHGRPDLYSGIAVWGSAPAIDPIKGLVYIGTGNNYRVPSDVVDCVTSARTTEDKFKCQDPKNYINAILALDINNGDVIWAVRTSPSDDWIVSCIPGFITPNPGSCPEPAGLDYDFGQAPLLVKACNKTSCPLLAIATAKSGIAWAINAATGKIYWTVEAGPGGTTGGSMFGSATDGKRYFVSISNSSKNLYMFVRPSRYSPPSTRGGALVAIDISTGDILWQTANPTDAESQAPVSYANGVVWYGSRDNSGHLFALNAETGDILFEFVTGGSVASGPSIVDGVVYAGSGYTRFGYGTPNNRTLLDAIDEIIGEGKVIQNPPDTFQLIAARPIAASLIGEEFYLHSSVSTQGIFKIIVERRLSSMKTKSYVPPVDILQKFIELLSQDYQIDIEILTNYIITAIFAVVHSTSNFLTNCLHCKICKLFTIPKGIILLEEQERLSQSKNGNSYYTSKEIDNLVYLDSFFKETLRLTTSIVHFEHMTLNSHFTFSMVIKFKRVYVK
ncbi:5737_t:CDS:10 [Funneliformis geosporum]|nr:5737_t:CDS:10 [Funneliformis geosporum]